MISAPHMQESAALRGFGVTVNLKADIWRQSLVLDILDMTLYPSFVVL